MSFLTYVDVEMLYLSYVQRGLCRLMFGLSLVVRVRV